MSISILQWNIWYKEDIRNIANEIKRLNPDIVCLQELTVNHPDQEIKNTIEHIASTLGYEHYAPLIPLRELEGQELSLANGIFSRFPIGNKRRVWVNEPKGDGGYDDEYREYVEVTLRVEERELVVGTAHMSYTHRFEVTDPKKAETDKLVAELKKPTLPFIFTGDLNATPGSYTIQSIEKVLKNAGPANDEKTWTIKPFSYQGFEEDRLNWRLDYAFVNDKVEVASARVVDTEYSDHLPLLIEFEV
ncbi:MAG: endonuclease/exonuclease/phosphatase family protein [Candidatus Saccharimonadales bacterium]